MNWFSQSRHWQNYTAFPRKCNVFLCSLFYDLKTLLRRNARSSYNVEICLMGCKGDLA